MVRLGIVATELTSVGEDSHLDALCEISRSERHVRWFELSLVLLISFGGSFLSSLYLMQTGKAGLTLLFPYRWTRGLIQEIPCLLLLAYVLSRRRRSVRDLGLRWSVRDVAVGLGLTIVSYLAYAIGSFL